MAQQRRGQSGRKKQKEEGLSGGMQFLSKLIGAVIATALVCLVAFIFVPNLLSNISVNMQMSSTGPFGAFPQPSWKLESSEKKDAGFFCKVEDSCPQATYRYLSSEQVTPKQLDSFLPGDVEVNGSCKPTKKNSSKPLCVATSNNASFKYSAEVLPLENGKGYIVNVLTVPTPALAGKS